MSMLSKLLGLDRHPQQLAILNDVGHTLMAAYGVPQDQPSMESVIGHEVGKYLTASTMPDAEKGLLYLFMTAGVHMGLDRAFGTPTAVAPQIAPVAQTPQNPPAPVPDPSNAGNGALGVNPDPVPDAQDAQPAFQPA